MQQRFSTCNASMLRCKLKKIVARIYSITGPLSVNANINPNYTQCIFTGITIVYICTVYCTSLEVMARPQQRPSWLSWQSAGLESRGREFRFSPKALELTVSQLVSVGFWKILYIRKKILIIYLLYYIYGAHFTKMQYHTVYFPQLFPFYFDRLVLPCKHLRVYHWVSTSQSARYCIAFCLSITAFSPFNNCILFFSMF